jgi:acetyltransferase-like isoleucine patch superfamily enzyme
MTYRELSAQALAEQDYDAFLAELEKSLTDGRKDPNEIVRDTLFDIYFGVAQPDRENLSLAARTALHNFDPRNTSTEPEYYSDIDAKLYAERKPVIWLWQQFDRSPLGHNSLVAHRFRRMLAPLIFRSVGENFKCWQFVEWSFGYNLSFGNNVVIHRHVLLDDRGGIDIGNDQRRLDLGLRKHLLTHPRRLRHPQNSHAKDAHRKRSANYLSLHCSCGNAGGRSCTDRYWRSGYSRRRALPHRGWHTRQNRKG